MATYAITLDFCETSTPEVTLRWADKRLIPPEATAKMAALRAHLRPKLDDGTVTREEMDTWMTRTFEVYAEHQVTREQVVRAMRDFPLRSGFIELLQWARIMDIPVGIVSGSCADFIDLALMNAGLRGLVTHVHSTQLTYKDSRVTGALAGSIVHNFTKGALVRSFHERHNVDKRNVIAVGDSNNDVDLAGEEGFLIGLAGSPEKAKQLKPRFNHIVVSDSLHDVLPIIKRRVLG